MSDLNPYSSIDSVIQTWALANRLVMFREFGGREARFCYISSSKGECFQISIEPPNNATVSVDVWSVETLDDKELHDKWIVQVPELMDTLDTALRLVWRSLGQPK